MASKKPEHTNHYLAEICSQASRSPLVGEIISEVSNVDVAKLPAAGLKNISSFFEILAEKAPQSMYQHFSVLCPLLDSSAHQVRSALVVAMSELVGYAHKCIKAAESGVNKDTECGNSMLLFNIYNYIT